MKPRHEHECERCIFLGQYREYDLYFCPSEKRPQVIARKSDIPYDCLTGMIFSREPGPLAYALAAAKSKNLYKNNLEKFLLPEESKNLYLVQGVCGQYSDKITWVVRAFRDRGSAETFAKACEEAASLWNSTVVDPPANWSLLDPNMRVDYPTNYHVIVCPIALRPEELNSSNDVCPICHQQVYVTSQGKVCEQGHEVF